MLSPLQKRTVLGTAILLIVVLFLVPLIRIQQYKDLIAEALSQAIGRKVTIQAVSIKTFPQPGLLLNGVVVADDPSISAEPMLRADDVLATLHVSSLWRGRLEIATLKLSYPSLNLARSADGRWNLESLLERARQTPSAPTTKKAPERRTRFPYIEAKGGRINLKLGQEKKVFALGEADFALWLASEDEWRMRLEARPIRTDENLSDTGTIKLEGAWHRAARLSETPMSVRFWWENGQLGQMTMLVYGSDRGFRGVVEAGATFEGTPENLKITADGKLEDFRRYDITSRESVSAQVHCDALVSITATQIRDLDCTAPLGGGGLLQAHGNVNWSQAKAHFQFSASAESVPAQFVVAAARHVKKDVPEDITASGMMSGSVTVHTDEAGTRTWAADVESSSVELRSSVLSKPLLIAGTRWHVVGPESARLSSKRPKAEARAITEDGMSKPDATAFGVEPVPLDLGGAAPALLTAWFSKQRFAVGITGDADLNKLTELARLTGLPSSASEVNGSAKGKLQIVGDWAGFSQPIYTADAQLQNMTLKLNGVASPVKVQSARFLADKNSLSLTRSTAKFDRVHTTFEFSATRPRNCRSSEDEKCSIQFDVKADEISVDEINSLLNPKAQKRPWYESIANTVLGSKAKAIPEIYAVGKVSVGKLVFKDLAASKFSSGLQVTPNGFTLTGATAEVLGGKFNGDLTSDFHGGMAVYSSRGTLQNVALANISALMRDNWGSGKLNLTYTGQAAGWDAGELQQSAAGSADFEWRDGILNHINLDTTGKPLQFKSFAGKLELKNGSLTISQSKLLAPKGIYIVSGTASLGRELDLKLTRDGAPSYSVSGTLQKPVIAPLKVPETQATLR